MIHGSDFVEVKRGRASWFPMAQRPPHERIVIRHDGDASHRRRLESRYHALSNVGGIEQSRQQSWAETHEAFSRYTIWCIRASRIDIAQQNCRYEARRSLCYLISARTPHFLPTISCPTVTHGRFYGRASVINIYIR